MPGATLTQSIQPTQRGCILYSGSAAVPASLRNATSCVVLGRDLSGNSGMVEAGSAGAILAVYLNPTTFINVGPYHNYFYSTASGGPALKAYGSGGTSYGPPIDWISGYITQTQANAKAEATIRKIITENPWCKAIFLDDGGPGWAGYLSLSSAQREAFYQFHAALSDHLRTVANELGILLFCNGVWDANSNQGYPQRGVHGCANYDIFCIEHHSSSELPFWLAVAGGQWRLRDPNGQRCMFVITTDANQTGAWRNQTHMAWIAEQSTNNYTANPPNVSLALTPHTIGLDLTGGGAGTTVAVSPSTASVNTGATQQFTATITPAGGTVSWFVNNVAGGNATVGTINASGLYTAPTTLPQGGIVTVQAVKDGSGESASATVTVVQSGGGTSALLPDPPAIPNKAWGNRFIGTIANAMGTDYARGVVLVSPPEAGYIDAMRVGVDGLGGGSVAEPFTLDFYAVDAAGVGQGLLGSGAEIVVNPGDAGAWRQSVFASRPQFAASTPYLLVITSGGTQVTARFIRNDTANQSRGKNNVYANGPAASFADAAVGSADICIYIEYTPIGIAGASLAGNIGLSLDMKGNATTDAVGGVIVPGDQVMQRNRYELRTVPVSEFYFDLGGGVPGPQIIWQASDQTFRYADEQ